jgi:hypothetical protein
MPALALVLLLDAIDQAYNRPAWHGPNLRGAIRRVTAEEAAWRAGPQRHCIAEIVVHAAYWKYTVRRRLLGLKRGGFALKGSNWFELDEPWNDAAWQRSVALLDAEHAALREAVGGFPAAKLARAARGGRFTFAALIHGIALHDVYHAGQIQFIRRLIASDR